MGVTLLEGRLSVPLTADRLTSLRENDWNAG